MTFTLGSLRNTHVYTELANKCRSYSVLISLNPDLRQGGSGTLITYKKYCGILSATHVIAEQTNARNIFAPIQKTENPKIFLNDRISIKRLIFLETSVGIHALQQREWPEGALDICLIQLEQEEFLSVLYKSGKRSVDLSEHKTKYLNDFEKYCGLDRNHNWTWAVDGSPREDAIQNDCGILESRFDGLYLCGGSKDGSTYRTQLLTLVSAPFDRESDISVHDLGPTVDSIPSKFGGISGGGMWQVSFSGNSVPEAINEMFFSGVCVAGKPQECLYARGPSALYDIFTNYLDIVLS